MTPIPLPPWADSAGSSSTESPRRKCILLVDDHPFMRAGVAQLIDKQPDMRVCGEAGDPTAAIRELARCPADLMVSDISMPGRSGFEFIKDLHAVHASLPILVLSMHDEAIYAERALRAGARGYIMKEAGGDKLLTAIRRVLSGQVYVSPAMSAQILANISKKNPSGSNSPFEKLTDREFEILQLIGLGKSTRDIATQLHLSPKTVDVHRGHMREKLNLTDSTALFRYAVRWVETQKTDR